MKRDVYKVEHQVIEPKDKNKPGYIAEIATPISDRAKTYVTEQKKKPSKDFKNNPGAGKRFIEWTANCGLTQPQIAKCLGVSEKTVREYVKDPAQMKEWASFNLKKTLGAEAYTDMVHGQGAYEKMTDEQKKKDMIKDIKNMLSCLKTNEVEHVLAQIKGLYDYCINGS